MSHPDHESPQDLVAAYALGALGAEETRAVEAYLATSPEAQREVAEYREVAALLALAGPEAAPRTDLRDRVLARVSAEKSRPLSTPASRPVRGPQGGWFAIAATLVGVVGLGLALLSRRELHQLRTAVVERDRALTEAQQQLLSREATLNAIMEPGVELYQLTASGDPDPGIQLFWDRERNRAIVHGFRLKPVPPGRAYQLWFIKDGKPVPSITFKPEPSGHAKVEEVVVPADGVLSAAAVTVEPENGSPQPTSPIVLVGALQQKS